MSSPARPIPVGCKKYRFNGAGRFETSTNSKEENGHVQGRHCVFECVATSDAMAVAKFTDATETAYAAAKQVLRLFSPKSLV